MKILFVSNNYTPHQAGVTRSIQVTIQALCKENIEVKLLVPDYKCAVIDPEHVIRVPAFISFRYKQNYFPILYRRKQILKNIVNIFNPDVIHVHHPFILGVDAVSVASNQNIPILFTFHTQYDRYLHYVPGTKKLYNWYLWRHLAWFCNQMDMIIFPSQSMQEKVGNYISLKKSLVLPSPIALEFFSDEKKQKKNQFHKVINLLYVGRFVPEKNINFLLDVMKLLGSGYRLNIVGYGYAQQELEAYAYNTLQLSVDQVQFFEQPSREEIKAYYNHADIFIFASQSETQGLVLAEAMALSLPVIALKGCGVVDIIKHGENGFIVENRQQMAKMIRILKNDISLKHYMRNEAKKTSYNYKPEIIAKRLMSCYHQVVSTQKIE